MNGFDQNVLGIPTTGFGSSGDNQTAFAYTPVNSSTAFFTTDLTEMYNGTYAPSNPLQVTQSLDADSGVATTGASSVRSVC